MKLGVLFSGGKDSTFALMKAMQKEEVVCLISILSKNPESYMFHTPNINLVKMQSYGIGLPLIQEYTEGKKEEELNELKLAIVKAVKEYGVEGIVTGANESIYQASRVQRICNELGLWCFNPIWKKDQVELVKEIIDAKFEVIISGIFAYPLSKDLLGKKIDDDVLNNLILLQKKYGISPSGEGGEIETTVLDAPFFNKRIEILSSEIIGEENSAIFSIKEARLWYK